MLQIAFLVSIESSGQGGVHWLGFMAFEKLSRRGALAWFHGVGKALEEGCISFGFIAFGKLWRRGALALVSLLLDL
jgi:hypothetical protein